MRNTILSGNSAGNCIGADPVSLGHNLESGTSCGLTETGDIQNGTASLGSLRDNGGPTKTRALGTTSDARDAGSSQGVSLTETSTTVAPSTRTRSSGARCRFTPRAPPPIATTGWPISDASAMTGQARVEPNGVIVYRT